MESQEDTPKKQSIKPRTQRLPSATKKECSPELLDRLQNMRIKAAEARKNKALLNEKSRLYKQERLKKVEEDAKKYDELMQKQQEQQQQQQQKEQQPLHVAATAEPTQKKKAKKKVIIEESSDDDESEEEVIIRRKVKKPQAGTAGMYPKSSSENEEFGRLTRNAINERLKEKINQERINYVTDLLRPSYY